MRRALLHGAWPFCEKQMSTGPIHIADRPQGCFGCPLRVPTQATSCEMLEARRSTVSVVKATQRICQPHGVAADGLAAGVRWALVSGMRRLVREWRGRALCEVSCFGDCQCL